MKTSLTVLLMALFSVFTVYAQNTDLSVATQYPDDSEALEVYQAEADPQFDLSTPASAVTWMSNKGRNWFLSLEGGLTYLGSENFREIDFTDNLKFTGGLAVGKWFTPVWGTRLDVSVAKLSTYAIQGASNWYIGQNYPGISGENALNYEIDNGSNSQFFNNRFYNDGKKYKNGYLCDFTYAAATVDLLVNLKNLFTAYNPDAFFNPVLYGGVGFAHTLKDGDRTAVNSIAGRFGLQLNFRIAKQWDLYLAGETLMVPEFFDRQVGGNRTLDQVISAKVGFTYHFGFNNFIKAPLTGSRVEVAAQPDMTQINALNSRINDLQARLSECLAKPAPTAVAPEVVKQPLNLEHVFFELDKYVVRNSEMSKIEKAANYLKTNQNAKLVLAGFADVKTGSPSYNMTLSKNRVNAVCDILVKNYGIDKSRLVLLPGGDRTQPFSKNEENRVVMFLE